MGQAVRWPDTRERTAQEVARADVMKHARGAAIDGGALERAVIAALREQKPDRVLAVVSDARARLDRFETTFRVAWGIDDRGEPVRS